MTQLLDTFNRAYSWLYEYDGVPQGYDACVEWFDENHSEPRVEKHITSLVEERGDFIASDREAAAFTIAAKSLKLV